MSNLILLLKLNSSNLGGDLYTLEITPLFQLRSV